MTHPIRCHLSDIDRRASDIDRRASDIDRRASDIDRRASDIGRRQRHHNELRRRRFRDGQRGMDQA